MRLETERQQCPTGTNVLGTIQTLRETTLCNLTIYSDIGLGIFYNVFNDVLTEYGMVQSTERSFLMTLRCSVDQTDREAIQFPCGKIEYTESLNYLGVELTSDLTDTTDVDAKLARGRGTFKSLSEVFHSTAVPIKLRVKLFHTLIVPTVLHGCE